MSEATDRLDWNAASAKESAAFELLRPSMQLRPRLSIDGNQWCALYGEDLQNGVAGFGSSPDKAYKAFDEAWIRERTTEKGEEGDE